MSSAGPVPGRPRDRGAAGPVALVAAGTAVGGLQWLRGREPEEAVLTALFGAIFVALACIDLSRGVLPNRIVCPALVLALALSGVWPDRGPLEAVSGAAVAFATALAARWISSGGLGWGDVKAFALAGAVVGYPDLPAAGLAAAIAGGLVAAPLVASGRADRGSRIPYGPFVAFGVIAVLS